MMLETLLDLPSIVVVGLRGTHEEVRMRGRLIHGTQKNVLVLHILTLDLLHLSLDST